MPNLLIEIGVEELPVDALDVIGNHLLVVAKEMNDKDERWRFSFSDIQVETTARRIAFFINSLDAHQMKMEKMLIGPPYEKSYDPFGKPTAALAGFLKVNGATTNQVLFEKDISIRSGGKTQVKSGTYAVLKTTLKANPVEQILPEFLKELFNKIVFPKTMRWESKGFRFPRPIRWIIALLDSKVLKFELAGVRSGKTTLGHRFLSPKPIAIPNADWRTYVKLLRRSHVILGLQERKKIIRKTLSGRYHQKHIDEELVETSAHLVEEPFLLGGTFLKTYLDLPQELLASCMKKNQKIFACYDAKGKLTSQFVAVLNGKRKGLPKIRADYENVLESRLRDARYFYDLDIKEPLSSKGKLLNQLVYLGKLGTMADKTARLEQLTSRLVNLLGRKDIEAGLKRVATLSKIDLMTQLVYEFPDLQGVAGREYAMESGENEEVAHAIEAQYLPRNLSEDYREVKKSISPLGAMFGLIDRLDHLVGAFGINLEPTGSQDPYALRRAGGVFVKLIHAYRFHFSLSDLISETVDLYGKKLEKNKKEITANLMEFFKDRMVFELALKPGTREFEILQSILKSSADDIADIYDRHEHLTALYERDPEAFIKAAKVVERTGNIVKAAKDSPSTEVKPELLRESLERELYRLIEERSGEIQEATVRRDYEKATLLFGKIFYGPIHDFFNKVMVNVEDAPLRANRQALMKRIHHLYKEKIADLSLLSKLE